jgi:hypothetical protein
MADTTTRKLLIDVEARYASVDQAMKRMADLSVEIRALQDLRKQEGKATDANKATLASLSTALKAAQKEYNQLNGYVAANVASARAFETAMGGVDDTVLSLQAQLTKATLAWKGLTGAQRDSEMGQALKARIDSLTKALFDNGTQLDRNKITVGNYAGEIEGLIAKMNREGQVLGLTSQAYTDLLTKYQMAEAKARQYILTLGEQSNEAIEAVADLKRMGAEIDRLNTTMGKYQSKTFNASYATFSLSQVVRELPNFAIDARLGFMALSNNLPMLADDFSRLTKELGSARKAFAAFAKSLLSVNTVMVLLSTVLVAWGPQILDFIKGLFGAEKATLELADAAGQLKNATAEGVKESRRQVAQLELMYKATQDANVPMDERLRLIGELQKLYPAYLGNFSEEEILAGKAEIAYLNLADSMLKVAVARKLADQYAENAVKIFEKEAALAEAKTKQNETYVKALEAGFDLQSAIEAGVTASGTSGPTGTRLPQELFGALEAKEVTEEYNKASEAVSNLEQEVNALVKANELLKANIKATDLIGLLAGGGTGEETEEDRAALLQGLLDIDTAYKESLIKAEQGYQASDFESKQAYERRLFTLKDSAERDKLKILLEYGKITQDEYTKQSATLDNLQTEFTNKQLAEVQSRMQKAKDELLKLLGDTEEIELTNTAKLYDDTLAAYEASLGDKSKLSGEQIYEMMEFELMVEYQKQDALEAIRAEYRKKEAEMNRASIIQNYAQELELAKKGITERYGITKKRIDDELALLDKQYGENAKMSEKDAKRYRELLEERTANDKAYEENKLAVREEFMAKGMELVSALSDIADALGEREEQQAEDRHDRESESLKRKYDKGLISKKSYDAQQLLLDKKLDAEKAKIARAQAIRERLLATFSIGINTAKAIMGIWADFPKVDFGISAAAMSAVVGALGLAQAAAVWATPLPKASKGLLIHGPSHAGGGVPIEAEGGEAIINAKSTSMFKPLLSAINRAGGGVKFASGGIPVGLRNDGGFSARQALSGTLLPTAEDIARAVAGLELSVSVEQIEKGRAKYAKVKSRGTY